MNIFYFCLFIKHTEKTLFEYNTMNTTFCSASRVVVSCVEEAKMFRFYVEAKRRKLAVVPDALKIANWIIKTKVLTYSNLPHNFNPLVIDANGNRRSNTSTHWSRLYEKILRMARAESTHVDALFIFIIYFIFIFLRSFLLILI